MTERKERQRMTTNRTESAIEFVFVVSSLPQSSLGKVFAGFVMQVGILASNLSVKIHDFLVLHSSLNSTNIKDAAKISE